MKSYILFSVSCRYTAALHALVNGDNAKKSLLFNEFPGTVVSLLTDMIIVSTVDIKLNGLCFDNNNLFLQCNYF